MTNYNAWLSENLDKYGARTLKELVLPGSHDSGMYSPEYCVKMGSPSTTKTQNLSIANQLANGCRFFDIRITISSKFQAPGGFRTHHSQDGMGCTGETLSDVLGAVRGFLQSNAELVILKMSHFEGFDDTTHNNFLGEVASGLGGLLPELPTGCKLAHVPLRRLLARRDGSVKGTVLILHSDLWGVLKSAHPNFFLCRSQEDGAANQAAADIVLFDKYSDSSDANDVMDGQIKYLLNRDIPMGADKAAGNHQDRLFLVSWTITESGFKQVMATFLDALNEFAKDPIGALKSFWDFITSKPRNPPVAPAIVWDASKVNDHMDRIVNAVPTDAIAQNLVPNLIYVDAYNSATAQIAMQINEKLNFRQPRTGLNIGDSLELGDWLPSADHAVILKLETDETLKLKDMRDASRDIFSVKVSNATKVVFEEGGRLSAYYNGERLAYLSPWVSDKVGWLEIASGGSWQTTLDLWSKKPIKNPAGVVTNEARHLGQIETAAEHIDWPSDTFDYNNDLRSGGRIYSRYFDYFLQFDGNDGSLRLYDQRREFADLNPHLLLPRVKPVAVCTLWSGSRGEWFGIDGNGDLVIRDKDSKPIETVLPCPPHLRDNNRWHSVSGTGRLFVSDEGRVFYGLWNMKELERGPVWLKAWPSNDILLSGQTLVPPNKLVHGGMEMAFDADKHLAVTYGGRLLYYFGPEANMTTNPVPAACAAVDSYGQLNVYGTTGTPKPLANLDHLPLPEFAPVIYTTNERNNRPQYMFLNDHGRLQFNDGYGIPVLYVNRDRSIALFAADSRQRFWNSQDIRTTIPIDRKGYKKGESIRRGEYFLSGSGTNMLSLGLSGQEVVLWDVYEVAKWDVYDAPGIKCNSVQVDTADRLELNQDGRLVALDAAGNVMAFLSKAANNAAWLSIEDGDLNNPPAILLWDKQPVWEGRDIQNGAVVVERITEMYMEWPSDTLDHYDRLPRGSRIYSRYADYFLQFSSKDGSLRLYDQRHKYAELNPSLSLPRVKPVLVCEISGASQGEWLGTDPDGDLLMFDKGGNPLEKIVSYSGQRDNDPRHGVGGASRLFVSDEGRVFYGMCNESERETGPIWMNVWPSEDILLSGHNLTPWKRLIHGGMEMSFTSDYHLAVTYMGQFRYYFGPENHRTTDPVPVSCATMDVYGDFVVYGTSGTPPPLMNLAETLPVAAPKIYSSDTHNGHPQYLFLNDHGRIQFNDGFGIPTAYIELDGSVTACDAGFRKMFVDTRGIRTWIPIDPFEGLKKGESLGRGESFLSGTGANMLSLEASGREVVLWNLFVATPGKCSSVQIGTADRLAFNQDGRLVALNTKGDVVAFLSKPAGDAAWLSIDNVDPRTPAILLWDKQPVWSGRDIQNGATVVERITELKTMPAR